MSKLFKINPNDNVSVALEDLKKGYSENGITLLNDVPFGHKVLLTDLKKGDFVIKYGNPIGKLLRDEKQVHISTNTILKLLSIRHIHIQRVS